MSKRCEADTIAIIGAGLIGRFWAIVFARAACNVKLYDNDEHALAHAGEAIERSLNDLEAAGLISNPTEIASRIRTASVLSRAVHDVLYVQECGPEEITAKRELFSELEAVAPIRAILASSSSGIMASEFANHLATADRCLFAHPVNPRYLIPLVELSPGPKTSAETLVAACKFPASVGQVPFTLNQKILGFALNRLQGASLNEALNLVQSGYIEAADLDHRQARPRTALGFHGPAGDDRFERAWRAFLITPRATVRSMNRSRKRAHRRPAGVARASRLWPTQNVRHCRRTHSVRVSDGATDN